MLESVRTGAPSAWVVHLGERYDVGRTPAAAAAGHFGTVIVDTLVEPPSTCGYKDRGRGRPRFLDLVEHRPHDASVS